MYFDAMRKNTLVNNPRFWFPGFPLLSPSTSAPGLLLLCFPSSSPNQVKQWELLPPGLFSHCHHQAQMLTGRSCLCLKECPLLAGPVLSLNIPLLAAHLHSACELTLGGTRNWEHFGEEGSQHCSAVDISFLSSQVMFCLLENSLNNFEKQCLQTFPDIPEGCNLQNGNTVCRLRELLTACSLITFFCLQELSEVKGCIHRT